MPRHVYEIYFFGLLAYIFDGEKRVEIVNADHHCPTIYGPGIVHAMKITGDVRVSLSGSSPEPYAPLFHYLPKLTDHIRPKDPSEKVHKKDVGNFTLPLPSGVLTVASFYDQLGEFDDHVRQPIPKVTLLQQTSETDAADVSMGGTKIGTIEPDSWLLIANIGKPHECVRSANASHEKMSHFRHYQDITDGDAIDGLCSSVQPIEMAGDKRMKAANFAKVDEFLRNGVVPCHGSFGPRIYTQVDGGGSQYP